jgi:pilus assembly protein CpaC
MNEKSRLNNRLLQVGGKTLVIAVFAALGLAPIAPVMAATPQPKDIAAASTIEFAPQVFATVGKSTLLKLPSPAARISVGNAAVADVILLNPREIYLLGKKMGSTNLILWSKSGQSTVVDVVVEGTSTLQAKLQQLMPGEKDIKVNVAADTLVLSGTVSDAVKANRAMALAEAYAGKNVVNMLQIAAPQQVMLEVKIAEVSKILLDKLGVNITADAIRGSWTYSLVSDFLSNGAGLLTATRGADGLSIDAEKKDNLVKILAEPTIMAISGQEGAFLAGGKIYIPVPQAGAGGTTITLEEKEFGVGLKFTPTVLEGGLINLQVTPEVSEVSATGTAVSINGSTSILPSITTRRASTTVQLHDGQSFAIGGLIKNNITETVKALPVLGEIPILGALFRSSEFQNDRTELMFVVTPRLVKPLPPNYRLPTDDFIEPSRSQFFLEGKLEGSPGNESRSADASPSGAPADKPQSGPSGFEMK